MQRKWLMLIAIASGWILFLVGNETMIKEEHNEITFEPTTLGWMLNVYGMGLFVFGVLVLHKWCETSYLKDHETSIA